MLARCMPMTLTYVPLTGELQGELYARSIRANGRWFLLICEVTFENDRPVNVLEVPTTRTAAVTASAPVSDTAVTQSSSVAPVHAATAPPAAAAASSNAAVSSGIGRPS